MEKQTVFDHISEAAQKAGVRLILIGGFAVNAYGVSRNTEDVDFLVLEDQYEAFKDAFSQHGYREVFRNDLFAKFEGKASLDMPVDILFLDARTFGAVWGHGKNVLLHGVDFRTPSLSHLIALKLHAVKQGGEEREWKDLDDILKLVDENHFDGAELETLCRKFGPPGVCEMILRKRKESQNG